MSAPKTAKKKLSFSKVVVVAYFFVLVGLALAMVVLAYISIQRNYLGSLSYLGYPFTAFSAAGGVILPAYFSKSGKENTAGGITYESAKAHNFAMDAPEDESI